MTDIQECIAKIKQNIGKAVFGQEEIITETLVTLFTGGHILTTGAPGLAKTTLVKVIASSLGLTCRRIQFTPDLLPSDITGCEILTVEQETGKRYFEFARGPVFTNLLLADEINRASPRTQSALLEAMQEHTVTVAGKKYQLPEPFMVFATQNPYESEGTFPLPEAQIDRFLLHSLITYPHYDAEKDLLTAYSKGEYQPEQVDEQISIEQLREIIATSQHIPIAEPLLNAINDLVRSTRPDDPLCPSALRPHLIFGASPRASLSMLSACRALSLLRGDKEVRWQHLERIAKPALRHRLRLAAVGDNEINPDTVVEQLLGNFKKKNARLAVIGTDVSS